MTGPVTVTLWGSWDFPDTDFPDTDVTATLVDVYPPNPDYPSGFSMNVTDSISRLRYRNGGSAELNPNTGEPLWASAVVRVAVNTLHHAATHPSRVTLPLLDA